MLGYIASYSNNGDIYGGGTTQLISFPQSVGVIENGISGVNLGVISKINGETFQHEWSSVFHAEETAHPLEIEPAPNGDLIILFSSISTNFPTTGTIQGVNILENAINYFLVRLDDNGALIWSYCVGSGGNGDYRSNFMFNSIHGSRNMGNFEQLSDPTKFLVSFATNDPTLFTSENAFIGDYNLPGNFDSERSAYVAVVDIENLSLENATYLSPDGIRTKPFDCKVLENGNFLVCGSFRGDYSLDFNCYQNSNVDEKGAVVWVLNQDLSSLQTATLFDKVGSDLALAIDESSLGQIIVNILTETPQLGAIGSYSVLNSHNNIIGFNSDLTEIDFSGTFGGAGEPGIVYAKAFLVDRCDKIYVSGNANFNSYTSEMNITPDAFTNQGGFYMASFEPEMADISFATLLGGNHTDGGISTYDEKGVVYQGVCSVLGDPFLTTDNAWDDSQLGVVELGLYKIDFQSDGAVSQFTTELNNPCAPVELQLNNHSTLGEYQWFLDD
ncbi:MAG: hypothetical protein ACPGED_09700, partial [Flavobacteriales bacterium]